MCVCVFIVLTTIYRVRISAPRTGPWPTAPDSLTCSCTTTRHRTRAQNPREGKLNTLQVLICIDNSCFVLAGFHFPVRNLIVVGELLTCRFCRFCSHTRFERSGCHYAASIWKVDRLSARQGEKIDGICVSVIVMNNIYSCPYYIWSIYVL